MTMIQKMNKTLMLNLFFPILTEPFTIHLTFQIDQAMQEHLRISIAGFIKSLPKKLDIKTQTTHGA
jgi:hypothetical protein